MLDCDDDKWRGTRLKLIPAVRLYTRTSLLLQIVIILLLVVTILVPRSLAENARLR